MCALQTRKFMRAETALWASIFLASNSALHMAGTQ